ncbi:hypothetical protein F5B18DRAFT_428171 [Nemania serpens]|nr:hypothetical protein F5B18DRAFT_428171 [Nemania serpens]
MRPACHLESCTFVFIEAEWLLRVFRSYTAVAYETSISLSEAYSSNSSAGAHNWPNILPIALSEAKCSVEIRPPLLDCWSDIPGSLHVYYVRATIEFLHFSRQARDLISTTAQISKKIKRRDTEVRMTLFGCVRPSLLKLSLSALITTYNYVGILITIAFTDYLQQHESRELHVYIFTRLPPPPTTRRLPLLPLTRRTIARSPWTSIIITTNSTYALGDTQVIEAS